MRNQFRMTGTVLFIVLLIFAVAHSSENLDKLRSEQATNMIRTYQKLSGIPGMAIGFAKGEKVWTEFYGDADIENGSQVYDQTKFRLASVSKVVTAAAALRLSEKGLLDIDAPIQKYVPSFPEHPKKITVRMLAGHLGGIRHYTKDDFQDCKHYESTDEALAIFQKDPLINEPGTKYYYSSYGFNLILAAMEAAAGKKFEQILKDEVFAPLALKNSGLDLVNEIVPGRTRFYGRNSDGKIGNAAYQDPSSKWASGGILSSAPDLLRFGVAHLADNYLSSSSREILFSSQHTTDGKETGAGFAWRIGKDWRGRRIFHHAGNMPGSRALILLYPDEQAAVVVLSNLYGEPPLVESTGQMIAEAFLQPDPELDSTKDLSGQFELSGDFSGKKVSGTLRIERNSLGFYHGFIEGLTPLQDLAAKNGMPTEIHVPRVFPQDQSIILVLASSGGLRELKLDPVEDGYRGTMEFPLKGSLHFAKKK